MAGGLAEAHASTDNCLKHQVAIYTANIILDLTGKRGAGIEHCKEYPLQREFGIVLLTQECHGIDQFRKALEGKILRLNRDDNRIGCQ